MATLAPTIDEIKTSIDAVLDDLQTSLRELNREVYSCQLLGLRR